MISIIVPVYNVSEYIAKCLDSLINQTYKNLEIIVIDDGSTDSTGDIVDYYAKMDNRIKVIHKSNGGVSSARNAGLDIATGEYVGFVDGDDCIEERMYEVLIEGIRNNKCDICCCQIETINVDGTHNMHGANNNQLFTKEYIIENYFFNDFVKDLMYSQCNKIFKKEILAGIRYKNYKYGEDILFVFECLMNSEKIYYDNFIGYYYIHRENSAMTSNFSPNRIDYIDAIREIENYCEQKYPFAVENVKLWVYQHTLVTVRQFIYNNQVQKNRDWIKKQKQYLKIYKNKYFSKMSRNRKIDYYAIMWLPMYYKFLRKIKK